MRDLFPPFPARQTFTLPVSPRHTLYVEECGNPEGTPIVFLHGGPGGGISPDFRRFFNPEKWRIILFDQRGCGKSTPFADLEENTTWDLVSDIEKIRKHLHIDRWHVFGGSWGSTLALTYAINHPDKVLGLILRGIFLLRKKEIDWFYQEGCSKIYPDLWEEYLSPIIPEERSNMVESYYKLLTSSDSEIRSMAARAWSVWEGSTSKLYMDPDLIKRFETDQFAEAFARIECHYFINKGFFPQDNYLLDNIDKIRHIPGCIVQGRYDVVCPSESAWDLHRAWPEADFHIIQDAGHSAMEPGIRSKLVETTERFAQINRVISI